MAALRGKALVAYLLVCLFWGSTYLAIRIGVGVFPPFLFAGVRFFIAGVLLLTGALLFGDKLPGSLKDWIVLSVVGLFLLTGGNAMVVWAEQYTPSGVASIFVVTVALWMAFFDAVIPGGAGRISLRVIAGLLVGFAGTILLVGASPAALLHADLRGPIALTGASASGRSARFSTSGNIPPRARTSRRRFRCWRGAPSSACWGWHWARAPGCISPRRVSKPSFIS